MNISNNTIKTSIPPLIYKTGYKEKVAYKEFFIKLIFSFIFAVLMAISANSFFYLPFTPVPITIQVATVFMSAIFLGSKWAAASQLQYILMGIMGFPVFSGFKSGIIALAGPTGGYIIGFLAAAFITGYIIENANFPISNSVNNIIIYFFACIIGLSLIYLLGYIQLVGFLSSIYNYKNYTDLLVTGWNLGVKPFFLIDFIKILIILNIFKLYK